MNIKWSNNRNKLDLTLIDSWEIPSYQIDPVLDLISNITVISSTVNSAGNYNPFTLDSDNITNYSDSLHKIWPYTFFSDTVQNCFSPNVVLIADSSPLSLPLSGLYKSGQIKLFDQWQGVPIINSTYTFKSNNTLENVFIPQSNGYLFINESNIIQVDEYSLNYNNLINLPDPTNLNYTQIIYKQENVLVNCKYQ